ncbi:efflux RND transporter periplasmic adaptor subunit [Belliella marina]|uniref:Efflux RND transporter periplasmic adaptor subunit n=1 Tax=Belliella marina TaxID=1644146 RepID=A0ABW4VL21_9BACT
MILKPMLGSFLIGVVFFSSCSNPKGHQEVVEKENFCLDDNFKSKIELEQPKIQVVTEGIHLTGVVEPNPDKVIHFVSLVGGVISNTNFSLGDKVSKGQVLAELRSTELSELQSQSKTITSQIKVAEKNLQSVQSMYDDNIASEKDLMEAQSELEVMVAERERINSNLSLFSASPERGVFQIKSPSSGIITSKTISAGTQISAEGEPLFTVSDLGEVWVLVNVYATNVMNIETGMPVKIKTLSYPDETFEGKITTISQVLDSEAKVLKARVVLQNEDLRLKPGMIVDVTAMKELKAEGLSIPTVAMVFYNNQNYVVVHRGDCDIEIRQVEILTKSNGLTFLKGGLHENEKIISKNHLLIYEQIKNFQN